MHHPIIWVESSLGSDGMVQMVAERLKELEEFVALLELELLVYFVGTLRPEKIEVVSPSRIICVGVRVLV